MGDPFGQWRLKSVQIAVSHLRNKIIYLLLKLKFYLNKISSTPFLLWFYKMSLVPGLPDLIHRHCIDVLVGWEEMELTCRKDHQLKYKHRINVDKRNLRKKLVNQFFRDLTMPPSVKCCHCFEGATRSFQPSDVTSPTTLLHIPEV